MTEHNDTVVADTPATDLAGDQATEAATNAGETSQTGDLLGADRTADATSSTDADTDTDTDTDTGDGDDDERPDAEGAAASTGPRRRPAKVADLEREGEVAADFLETLLDIADLDGDIDVDVDGDRAAVSIVDSEEGRVPRRLVGQDGKVLEALQELTRLAVQSATGERSRLMLDVAGHRAERRSSLVELAHTVIEQVKATGEKAALDPMTAFERKVVHDEVLAAGLSSESDGVEPRRFVVILPS